MDIFAPGTKVNGCFIVLNTAPQIKTISIFNYPINYLCTRDLIQIPGVSESSIRASLLKGVLREKIRNNDIIVLCSDIDLLQFNAAQLAFLQGAGIVNGLTVSGSGGITPQIHETLLRLIHYITEGGPGHGFPSGSTRITLPTGSPFPTSITWYLANVPPTKFVEKLITYNASQFPVFIQYNMYDNDGITILQTVIDVITYSGPFESQRIRSVFP
jgi:hypothetical protein